MTRQYTKRGIPLIKDKDNQKEESVPYENLKEQYEEVTIKIKKDDTLTSKHGFLFQSSMLKRWYKVKKVEYLGDGNWKLIGNREDVDVTNR